MDIKKENNLSPEKVWADAWSVYQTIINCQIPRLNKKIVSKVLTEDLFKKTITSSNKIEIECINNDDKPFLYIIITDISDESPIRKSPKMEIELNNIKKRNCDCYIISPMKLSTHVESKFIEFSNNSKYNIKAVEFLRFIVDLTKFSCWIDCELIPKADVEAITNNLFSNINKLPLITRDDPAVIILEAKLGELILFNRPSESCIRAPYFRKVI